MMARLDCNKLRLKQQLLPIALILTKATESEEMLKEVAMYKLKTTHETSEILIFMRKMMAQLEDSNGQWR
ncbi:hypothetical protein V6N13_005846 [Hibiscus sabdariffa]